MESHESTRQRVESSLLTKQEDRIAGKGFTSKTRYNLVHKFIPMLQAMQILDATAGVDKEWQKFETIPAWRLEKIKSKKEVILEPHRDKKKVHFATLMVICHPNKTRSKNPKLQKKKKKKKQGQSRVSRWQCKRRLWSLRK